MYKKSCARFKLAILVLLYIITRERKGSLMIINKFDDVSIINFLYNIGHHHLKSDDSSYTASSPHPIRYDVILCVSFVSFGATIVYIINQMEQYRGNWNSKSRSVKKRKKNVKMRI